MRPFQFKLRHLFLLISGSAFFLYVALYLNAYALQIVAATTRPALVW